MGPSLLKAWISSSESFSGISVRRCLFSLHSVINHFMAKKRFRLSFKGTGTWDTFKPQQLLYRERQQPALLPLIFSATVTQVRALELLLKCHDVAKRVGPLALVLPILLLPSSDL